MLELGKSKRSLRRGVVASVFASHRIAKHRIAIPGGQLAAAVARRPSRSKEAAVTVRRASRLGNSRRRPPSNGIDFAASPPHAPLELEQQDRMLELGEGQGTSPEQQVRGPATAGLCSEASAKRCRSTSQGGSRRHRCRRCWARCAVALAAPAPRCSTSQGGSRGHPRRPRVCGFAAIAAPARHRCPPRCARRDAAAFAIARRALPAVDAQRPLRHPRIAAMTAHVLSCSQTIGGG
jgi:hypothetical protein